MSSRACQKQPCIQMNSLLRSWDNHVYCGTIVIGGKMCPPQRSGWGALPPVTRPPRDGAHVRRADCHGTSLRHLGLLQLILPSCYYYFLCHLFFCHFERIWPRLRVARQRSGFSSQFHPIGRSHGFTTFRVFSVFVTLFRSLTPIAAISHIFRTLPGFLLEIDMDMDIHGYPRISI